MALLFYRRPDYLSRSRVRPELDESLCASYLEAAEISRLSIPASLSFEDIVKNNTLPPCSLNDFMDYLMYVEYNAECLQFFLWYCGYVERWSKLSQDERDMSPMWHGHQRGSVKRKHTRTRSFAEKTERFNRILAILEKSPKHESMASRPVERRSQRSKSGSTNFSWPNRAVSEEIKRWGSEVEKSLNPSDPPAQPLRDEMFRVVRHYIATGGPRQLNLTHQDRTACIQAAEQTTHPSALLPAFAAAEALLRGQCHPNFVRWSVSNSNRPRVIFVRGLGLSLLLMGLALDVVLILSSLNQWIRLLVTPVWIFGFTFLLASRHGVCVVLHWNYKRNLRPWEQFADEDLSKASKNDEFKPQGHQRSDTESSIGSSGDEELQKTKEGNDGSDSTNMFDAEPWVDSYHEKSLWKRIFEVSVSTQNRHVRAMRDRIMFMAILWASLMALMLAICSVFIPSPGLF